MQLKKYFKDPVEYELKKPNVESFKTELLEPNHSHFILVDNAQLMFGGEIDFRARLEAHIARLLKVPLVLLVVEGGPNTAKTAFESIKNNIPCIFVDVNFLDRRENFNS